jgi:ABC-type transport system substrate-binding protein
MKKSDLYDVFSAKSHAEKAHAALGGAVTLRLAYPDDDPRVQAACETIRDEVKDLGASITLELRPRHPHDLYKDVEVTHDYDLAYYHYDFPDEYYWLWPLFDPSSRAQESGGGNYFGYQDDGALATAFQLTLNHREFAKVKRFTHAIHEIINSKMIFIPLWQLDTHIAYHKGLDPKNIDPLLVFTDIEKWTMQAK